MAIERWDPFDELQWLDDRVNRLWRSFGKGLRAPRMDGSWAVEVDVAQKADKVVVSASVPGAKPEDLAVTAEDGVLTIKGRTESGKEGNEGDYMVRERRAGSLERSLRLPPTGWTWRRPARATSAA